MSGSGINLPILDAHIHLDPNGRPREAVRSFLERGGTHLMIVHKPYHSIKVTDIDKQIESFETTIEMKELAEEEGAVAWAFVGPYPGELPRLIETIGSDEAYTLMKDSITEAVRMVKGRKALGLGEIGRVHFPVSKEIQDICDEILLIAFTEASSLECPVILHTESFHSNPDLMCHLSDIAEESGCLKKSIIKHYSGRDLLSTEVRHGISISMQCRKNDLKEGLSMKADFLLETDYIDDPRRPNVVMPPDTVPKKIKWAYATGILDEAEHERLMVDLPRDILGVNTSL